MVFSTADLCDHYQDTVQVVLPGFQHYAAKDSFSGAIVTLRVDGDFLLIKETLGLPGDGRVLVIDGNARMTCALLGDRLAAMATENRWSGILINGCIRDAVAVRETNIGVMAIDTCPRRPRLEGGGEKNVVLQFAGVTFSPGHFLYADTDGIILSESKLEPA